MQEATDDTKSDGVVPKVTGLVARLQQTKPMRVLARFSNKQGNLLSAGMSYQSLFAIFAAIWLVFSIAGIWLTGNKEFMDALVNILNQAVPGLIGKDGAISEHALTQISGTLGWTGLIAAVGLLGTAIGWLSSTREAVRAMFEVGSDSTNFIMQKLRDLGLAFGFGIVLIVASLCSLASTALLGGLFELFGVSSKSFWVEATIRVVGFLLVVALNTLTLAAMYRVLSHLRIPLRNLWLGALIGSVALAVLSTLSGLVLGGASKNPLAASFAVIIGLLIWFNLVCRVILLSAAWIAVGMADRGLSARRLSPDQEAAERAEQEHQARLVLANAAVDKASETVDAARGFKRRRAVRRLAKAREHRDGLEAAKPGAGRTVGRDVGGNP